MLSKAIKFLQANLLLNLVSIVILLVITITVVYLTTYIHGSNIELQTMLEKNFSKISKDIKEVKEITTKEFNLTTEYHYLITEHCTNLEKNSLDIQEYITLNYTTVPEELATTIAINTVELCRKHNINQSLIVGLMEIESAFNPFAISRVGARGLLQVMPSVWEDELGIRLRSDLHDVGIGIESGIKVILIYLNNSNNDLTKALQKYNGIATGSIFSNKVYAAMERFEEFLANRGKDN